MLRGFVDSLGRGLLAEPGLARQFAPLRRDSAALVAALELEPERTLYLISAEGICYRGAFSGPAVSESQPGTPLAEVIEGDEIVAVLPQGTNSHYLLASEQGEIKRVEEATLRKAPADGMTCYRLAPGDRLVAVAAHGYQDHVGLATAEGQLLRLDMSRVRAVQSADAGGMAGVKLHGGDRVVSAVTVAGTHLLTVHASGAAKRVLWAEYPDKGRSSAGVVSAAVDKPLQGPGPAGEVVFACSSGSEPLVLFSQDGELRRLAPEAVALGSRFVVSRPALRLVASGRVRGRVERFS